MTWVAAQTRTEARAEPAGLEKRIQIRSEAESSPSFVPQIDALTKDPDGRISEQEVTDLCAKAIEILEKVATRIRLLGLIGPQCDPRGSTGACKKLTALEFLSPAGSKLPTSPGSCDGCGRHSWPVP